MAPPHRKLLLKTQRVQTNRHARLQTDQSFSAMIYLAAAVINSR
jgi:hypothetical protein